LLNLGVLRRMAHSGIGLRYLTCKALIYVHVYRLAHKINPLISCVLLSNRYDS
jgi:hypothetical protein